MRKLTMGVILAVIVGAGVAAFALPQGIKLPKCSKRLCQDVGCAADFYCAAGAHVRSCADICNG